MRQVPGGYIYTVPLGLVLHCASCKRDEGILRAGDECFVEDSDSSQVYCLKHIPIRKRVEKKSVERRPSVPKRRRWERVYE